MTRIREAYTGFYTKEQIETCLRDGGYRPVAFRAPRAGELTIFCSGPNPKVNECTASIARTWPQEEFRLILERING